MPRTRVHKAPGDGTPCPCRAAAADLIAHIEHLRAAAPAATVTTIASAAGVCHNVILTILGDYCGTVRADARSAILATTPEAVRRGCAYGPAKKAIQVVHSLEAQAWHPEWISQQLGYRRRSAPAFVYSGKPRIRRDLYDRVLALADRIGDETGPYARGAAVAQAAGYLPLRFYDESGDLLPDDEAEDLALLADPDAERDEHAWAALRRLCALRSILVDGMLPTHAVERHATTLNHHWRRLHARLQMSRAKWPDEPRLIVQGGGDPNQDPYVQIIRRYVEAIPISEVAIFVGDWVVADVPLSYDPRATEKAMLAEIAAECGKRCKLCAGKQWVEPVAPVSELRPVAIPRPKCAASENNTPWRREPAVIRSA